MSSIFDLIDEFEKEENEKNLLSSFNKETFMNGFYAGQYSIIYDLNKYDKCYKGWFYRSEAIEMAISEGLSPEKEALSLALSETQFSNVTKNTRASIDIFAGLKREFNSLEQGEKLSEDYMKYLLRDMFRYSLGGNSNAEDFKIAGKTFMDIYNDKKEKQDGLSSFIQELLNDMYKEYFPIPQRLGRLMSIRFLQDINPVMKPIPLGKVLRRANLKYEIALKSNIEIWNNFLFESVNENAQFLIKKKKEIRNLRSKYELIDDSKRTTSRIPDILDYIFEFPIFDSNKLKKDFQLTSTGTNKIIGKMLEKGIVRPIGSRQKNCKYICDDVLKV